VIQAAMGANPLVVDELPLRLAWLESRGLADEELSTRFFVHRTGRPSDKLLIAMRLLTLKPEEMTALIEADFDDEEQLMLLEGNDEERTEQSYMVGASLQFLGMYAKSRYAESMKASRLTYQMYASVSPHVQKHESIYRAWAAAVVRMDEQRALTKLGRWTYHPGRSEDALLHAWPFPVADEEER
jgi:SET domain-containing protein 6